MHAFDVETFHQTKKEIERDRRAMQHLKRNVEATMPGFELIIADAQESAFAWNIPLTTQHLLHLRECHFQTVKSFGADLVVRESSSDRSKHAIFVVLKKSKSWCRAWKTWEQTLFASAAIGLAVAAYGLFADITYDVHNEANNTWQL